MRWIDFLFLVLICVQAEIEELQDRTYAVVTKGKAVSRTIRIFLGGDYDFLCENFDQSNAASNQFCLWCPIDLNHKRDIPWSMGSPAWGEEGRTNTLPSLKARARKNRNPVFKVELDRVVVLPLHIVLGLVAAYLMLLKREVRICQPGCEKGKHDLTTIKPSSPTSSKSWTCRRQRKPLSPRRKELRWMRRVERVLVVVLVVVRAFRNKTPGS